MTTAQTLALLILGTLLILTDDVRSIVGRDANHRYNSQSIVYDRHPGTNRRAYRGRHHLATT